MCRVRARACLTLASVCLLAGSVALEAAEPTAKKKIVFVAGKPSHGYGAHEHNAGCLLLAKHLQQGMPEYEVVVFQNGWPMEPEPFAGADAIVMYADGGGGHPVLPHLQEVDELAKRGVGIVCLHYAVEVPKGEPGDHFLRWIGGYFETHWSVNPHWTAKFARLPEHPIARGVQPFDIEDEWYYHMRFRAGMEGVTPILSAIPPASTLERPDGPHSNNPFVRAEAGKPQHVAWAAERPDGGRGFGFTGGHFHWNWGDPNFRKLVLNAIVWVARDEVPTGGVGDRSVSLPELEANQDYTPPADFKREEIRERLKLPADPVGAAARRPTPRPRFRSEKITKSTPGHGVPIDVDITGAKQLFLVVTDAGDGFGCDWSDWAEPTLVGPSGKMKLTELRWQRASTDWGEVRLNQNANGGPLRIDGQNREFGLGTHANSVIGFELPEGYTRFQAFAGLDNGGTDQAACGSAASVQFFVYTENPGPHVAQGAAGSHDPAEAAAALDVAEGLEATLFASEPALLSLTNLDIDHRGRVWACEVVNYRGHNGKRTEGDRILILEDRDGDGQAETTKVFYQGRDIDSAMGICVLGDKVIVSASPHVLVFTDENGDDEPDRKEVLFANTGQPQHDHSAHSFLFGPDGKLYWNFGNTGQRVCDRDGNVVTDLAGNQVIDNGKPYFGGMPFRCDLDGSHFEVLAHNFRNNYETTVDSFGTLWQSDNDDDGNRGVRINYVMEYGNYGYRDELTGAGWQTPRTNWEEEIPLRHWHLNDPGVVPNLLQTGAGSPTGITVYEGRLLPPVFWDQVIHCDAGPNIVRAYPVRKQGAGYEADVVNLVYGARDNWFRPADVCVAPDGSVFITDWYDPGVGGHQMGDLDRGRIFRVAPPGHAYRPSKLDFGTLSGAIEGLKNPNLATRFMAFAALQRMGAAAEGELLRLFREDENPRIRARALWLLGKLPGGGATAVAEALRDKNPDLRITALRLARQQGLDLTELIGNLLSAESDRQVLRECAIALRHGQQPGAADLWAELALRHDGKDRWYLEALGIAADRQWDACLAALLERADREWLSSPAGRDIIWRSRAARTPELLQAILEQGSERSGPLARYLRTLDFQSGEAKKAVLLQLAFSYGGESEADRSLVTREALERLQPGDLAGDRDAVRALVGSLRNMPRDGNFVALVARFQQEPYYEELFQLALEHPNDALGVETVRTLFSLDQEQRFRQALASDQVDRVRATLQVLANAEEGRAVGMLAELLADGSRELEQRRLATSAVARTVNGAKLLLESQEGGQMPTELQQAAASALHASSSPDIRAAAAKLFPLPPGKDETPLPPLQDLVKLEGDAIQGRKLFTSTAQCANCHQAGDVGKEVGPALTEIGSKLSRQALFESVLFPSAAISHSYETHAAELESGNIVTGIVVSRSADEIALKTQDAIIRRFPTSEVANLRKLDVSLMPADLHKQLTAQELVDVVQFLTTLRSGGQ